jgi:hypothetical protein
VCFSASANFIGSAVLGAIGVVTLTEVKHRRELLFAAMPCFFALHHDAAAAYILYAHGLLPFLLPLSVLLIEPTKARQRRMLDFSLLGAALTVYLLWGLIAYPLHVSAAGHGIVYTNQITTTTVVAMLYVTATCGALFFSGFRTLVLLGGLNLAGLLIVMLVKRYEFTSLWCAYAAVLSVIIYYFFRQSRLDRPAKYALSAAA